MSIGRNFDIEPVRVLSIRSDPVRSGPVRSGPVRSGPGFATVACKNRESSVTTILGDSSYFAQRYPLVNYFQEPHLKVPAILIFLEICENLKTRLQCGFLFDKLSKTCCENQATVNSCNEFNWHQT